VRQFSLLRAIDACASNNWTNAGFEAECSRAVMNKLNPVLQMTRVKFATTASPLWEGNVWDGTMAGFPAMSSNQVPTATEIFGDWNEVVVGEWGVLEIEVNPYANFQAGIIGVRALYSLDVGVRRAFAFSVATSIT
jgi:hypothetical protein